MTDCETRPQLIKKPNGLAEEWGPQFKFRLVSVFLVLSMAHREIPHNFLTLCSAWLSPGKMWVTMSFLCWQHLDAGLTLCSQSPRAVGEGSPGRACGRAGSPWAGRRNQGKKEAPSRWRKTHTRGTFFHFPHSTFKYYQIQRSIFLCPKYCIKKKKKICFKWSKVYDWKLFRNNSLHVCSSPGQWWICCRESFQQRKGLLLVTCATQQEWKAWKNIYLCRWQR